MQAPTTLTYHEGAVLRTVAIHNDTSMSAILSMALLAYYPRVESLNNTLEAKQLARSSGLLRQRGGATGMQLRMATGTGGTMYDARVRRRVSCPLAIAGLSVSRLIAATTQPATGSTPPVGRTVRYTKPAQ